MATTLNIPSRRQALVTLAAGSLALASLAGCSQGGTPSTKNDAWDGSVDITWYTPGTKSFNLTSAAALAGLAQLVNDGTDTFEGKTINLATNVDLKDIPWTPIGGSPSSSPLFKGTFNGNGNSILGLYILSGLNNQALFGSVHGGCIKNLVLRGKVSAREEAAGLVSSCSNTTLENIVVDVDLFSTGFYFNSNSAGLAGVYSVTEPTCGCYIKDCLNNGTVDANSWEVGGLVACMSCVEGATLEITNCVNQGYVAVNTDSKNRDEAVGGLVATCGPLGTYKFTNCENKGNVTCTDIATAGGLVGSIGSENTYFDSCRNSGDVSTQSLVTGAKAGGLVGNATSNQYFLRNSTNTGTISVFQGSTFDTAPGGASW